MAGAYSDDLRGRVLLAYDRGMRTKVIIESAGARLIYLPPYSPDFSPIEPAFSKIKQLLRSLAARTRAALWSSMQAILDAVTPTDARNYFAHCGIPLRKA